MRIKELNFLFLTISIVAGIVAVSPAAYAAEAVVENAPGSSVPGCEETNECFLPYEVRIDVGDTVTWNNDDTAAHTVTYGAPDWPSEDIGTLFDSGLLPAGGSSSHTFTEAGTFEYFCMVHPWMSGVVIVGEAMAEEVIMGAGVNIAITAEPVAAGETMMIDVEFTDSEGNAVEHVNFDLSATQGNKRVLDETGVHDHDGQMSFTTMALDSDASGDNPVDVKVTFQGFGIDPPFTGPVGEEMTTAVVPEFGLIAMAVLAVGVFSIIAVTAKTRLIPRL